MRAALELCEWRGAGEVSCGDLRQKERRRGCVFLCVCVCA